VRRVYYNSLLHRKNGFAEVSENLVRNVENNFELLK